MCNSNKNEILKIDFESTDDSSNWSVEGSGSINGSNNLLNFVNSTQNTVFRRVLGSKLPNNTKLRIKSNIQVTKGVVFGFPDVTMHFTIRDSFDNIVETFVVEMESLGNGETYNYFLDRVLDVENHETLLLDIKIIEGNEQTISLNDLEIYDYTFCEDNIETYFVVDGLFEDSFIAESAGIELKSYKIDGSETLTNSFFSENQIHGQRPNDNWYFAKARLDSTERVSDTQNPNSFNPFSQNFKLLFDQSLYYSGTPTGTYTGSDYGVGIMNLGIGKPAILNGMLKVKKGAFYINIDYSKDLYIKFDVIMNNNNRNVFVNPDYIRTYYIVWDSVNCEKHFYFLDQEGNKIDQSINGFLFGITGLDLLPEKDAIGCDETFSATGKDGNHTFTIDFGNQTGLAGIRYNAMSVPDRFIIEWNGQTFDTGFVGHSAYDSQLIDAGVDPSDLNTDSPSTGEGVLSFDKTSSQPSQAQLTILAPLGATAWQIEGKCPGSIDGGGQQEPSELSITHTSPVNGRGVITIENGNPNEIIDLDVSVLLTPSNNFSSLNFRSPASIPLLDPLHLLRSGNVQLDIDGRVDFVYEFFHRGTGQAQGISCQIEMTDRSSSDPMPSITSRFIGL